MQLLFLIISLFLYMLVHLDLTYYLMQLINVHILIILEIIKHKIMDY